MGLRNCFSKALRLRVRSAQVPQTELPEALSDALAKHHSEGQRER